MDTYLLNCRPGVPARPGLDRRWSNADHPVPKRAGQASSDPWQLKKDAFFPWEKNEDEMDQEEEPVEKKKKVKPPSMAELTIPQDELKRLRGLGLMVRQRLKIGRQGVTPGIVEAIHNGWRTCEIVKVKCDGPSALNMKRTHEELEVSSVSNQSSGPPWIRLITLGGMLYALHNAYWLYIWLVCFKWAHYC